MRDLSEQERQDMIQRAKGGDPQANYELALWALDQAEEEPEEERWNRLAAKCLVKAAQGGYGPAVEHTAHLLHQTEAGETASDRQKSETPSAQNQSDTRSTEQANELEDADWVRYQAQEKGSTPPEEEDADAVAKAFTSIGAGGQKLKQAFHNIGSQNQNQKKKTSGSHQAYKGLRGLFSNMEDSKWKRVELICVIACILLVILIIVLIVSGRNKNVDEGELIIVPTPSTDEENMDEETDDDIIVSDYPSDDIKEEIAAATLSIYPSDEDYVTEETTATISAGSGLNLRRGPNSSYAQIILMENGATVEVYAYKSGWALVLYNGDTWGWCSTDYLK